MAPLTKHALVTRHADILDAKFDTHKTDIASDVDPIRDLVRAPLDHRPATPAVSIYYEGHTGTDAPQDTGETRIVPIVIEALYELPKFSDENVRKAMNFADALEWCLKQERELLHPTTGAKLAWLGSDPAYTTTVEIRWLHVQGARGGFALIKIINQVTVDEAPTGSDAY